jgi:triphosphatase
MYPIFARRGNTPLEPLLTKKLKRRLKPVFETHIHRTTAPVRKNGTRIEVALDEGRVRAGRQSAPISELELELKRGKPGELFKLKRFPAYLNRWDSQQARNEGVFAH